MAIGPKSLVTATLAVVSVSDRAAVPETPRGARTNCWALRNFLPVLGNIPSFRIYRKPRGVTEARTDRAVVSYSFPKGLDLDDRADFWVKAAPSDGYEPYVAMADVNNALTRWALSQALKDSIRSHLRDDQYFLPERGFLDEAALFMRRHEEVAEPLARHLRLG